MQIILVTEIWGRTAHVDLMAEAFDRASHAVTVIDPYDGHDRKFGNEQEAYAAFITQCGHDEYARRVCHAVSEAQEPVYLIGFSAGAGAVWQAVCQEQAHTIPGALCFYGSSIRTMLDAVPTVPVELIFPDHESHFDVQCVVQSLQGKPMTKCHVVPYGHGFMNPLSENYDGEGYERWFHWILDRIKSSI
nr:dienelactone hydrolase family protein [uncultured Pseudodesulfovibrio sp.]